MSPSSLEYLRHILDEAEYLAENAQSLTKDEFVRNDTLKRAFVRSLEVIGEAVEQLPDDLREKHSLIAWRAIAGMRDRLIHAYFGVDYELVWDVVINKIPALHRDIAQIIQNETDDQI